MRRLWLLFALLLTAAATVPTPEVEIENRSQYTIVELRLHETGSYEDAPNILEAPLAVGETIVPGAEAGPRFITFFREKYERGPILAFTTAQPIQLYDGALYQVTIFDESFRVEVIGGTEPSGGCSCRSITRGK